MATLKSPAAQNPRTLVIVAGIVLVWFAAAEVATQAWYRSHESKLPKNPVPATGEEIVKRVHDFAGRNGGKISEQDVGATSMEILKCSFGKTIFWPDAEGGSAVTVLKWNERSVVGGVESAHNPGICLRSAGWTVGTKTFLGVRDYCGVSCEVTRWDVSQKNLKMQAYSTVFRRYADKESQEGSRALWHNTRLKSVWSGRRDAPVLILLAYLPAGDDEKQTDARFDGMMRALFCLPAKP